MGGGVVNVGLLDENQLQTSLMACKGLLLDEGNVHLLCITCYTASLSN